LEAPEQEEVSRPRRPRRALAATALLLALPAPAAAQAADGEKRVAAERVGQSAERITGYWTRARMRAATPMEVEAPTLSEVSGAQRDATSSEGEPTVIPPEAPDGWDPGEAAAPPADASGHGRRQSIPFSSVELFDTTSYPNVVHGILFFRQRGFDYSCSGTLVNSPGHSVAMTAGHCVHGGGRGGAWSTHMVFIPGYQDKAQPFGGWTARRLFTAKPWRKRARFSSDIGAMALNPNSAGQTAESVVGARGIAFNLPREQVYRSYGYPVSPKPKFDGESLWACDSAFGTVDPFPERTGIPQSGIGCDMGSGSSGGGWVVDDQFVNSVNSFGYAFMPNVLFGTYFGDTVAGVYGRAVAG
jgi:V8-like Glu-specific endopeptidase